MGSFVPSINIPVTSKFGFAISPLFGFGTEGFTYGVGASMYFRDGDFYWEEGFGFGKNFRGCKASASYDGWGAGFGETSYKGGPFYGSSVSEQEVGTFTFILKKAIFSISNDLWGDKEDRWRTSAAELIVGSLSVGTYVETNYGKEEGGGKIERKAPWPVGKNKNKNKGAWKHGVVYSAPFWIGLHDKNSHIYRFGYSAPIVQNMTQNLVHKSIGKENFYLDYSEMQTGPYFFSGNQNSYNPWNH